MWDCDCNIIFHFYFPVKIKKKKKTYHSKKCHYRTQDLQELLPTLFWGRFSLTDLHPVSCWPWWWFFPSKRTKFKTCGARSVFRCLLPSRNQSAFRRLKIWSSSKFSLGNTMYVCFIIFLDPWGHIRSHKITAAALKKKIIHTHICISEFWKDFFVGRSSKNSSEIEDLCLMKSPSKIFLGKR